MKVYVRTTLISLCQEIETSDLRLFVTARALATAVRVIGRRNPKGSDRPPSVELCDPRRPVRHPYDIITSPSVHEGTTRRLTTISSE